MKNISKKKSLKTLSRDYSKKVEHYHKFLQGFFFKKSSIDSSKNFFKYSFRKASIDLLGNSSTDSLMKFFQAFNGKISRFHSKIPPASSQKYSPRIITLFFFQESFQESRNFLWVPSETFSAILIENQNSLLCSFFLISCRDSIRSFSSNCFEESSRKFSMNCVQN